MYYRIIGIALFFSIMSLIGCNTSKKNNQFYQKYEVVEKVLNLIKKYEQEADVTKLQKIISRDMALIRKEFDYSGEPEKVINIFFSKNGLDFRSPEAKKESVVSNVVLKKNHSFNFFYTFKSSTDGISLEDTLTSRQGGCFELSLILSVYLTELNIPNGIIYAKNHSFVRYFHNGKWKNCETTSGEADVPLDYYMNESLGYGISKNRKDFEKGGRYWVFLKNIEGLYLYEVIGKSELRDLDFIKRAEKELFSLQRAQKAILTLTGLFIKNGSLDKANELLDKALIKYKDQDPNLNAYFMYYKGLCQYKKTGDIQDAGKYFAKSIKTIEAADYLIPQGIIFLNNQLYDLSIKTFSRGIERNGHSSVKAIQFFFCRALTSKLLKNDGNYLYDLKRVVEICNNPDKLVSGIDIGDWRRRARDSIRKKVCSILDMHIKVGEYEAAYLFMKQWETLLKEDKHFIQRSEKINENYNFWITPAEAKQDKNDGNSADLLPINKDNKWGYIDLKGNTVIPCNYSYAKKFHNNRAWVNINGKVKNIKYSVIEGGRWGLINKKGEFILNPIYQGVEDRNIGTYVVKKKGKWGWIDLNGIPIIDFDHGFDKRTNLTIGDYIYIVTYNFLIISDKNGDVLSVFRTSWPWAEFSEELMPFERYGKWGAWDISGRVIIPAQYDKRFRFLNGLAFVQRGERIYAINKKNERLFQVDCDRAYGFSEGLGLIKRNGTFGYINKKGDLVIDCKFNSALAFQQGLARVSNGDKWGMVDKKGNIIIEYTYDNISQFRKGRATVTLNEKEGIISKNGETILPIVYDSARVVDIDGTLIYRVLKKGQIGYIDENLKWIWPVKD